MYMFLKHNNNTIVTQKKLTIFNSFLILLSIQQIYILCVFYTYTYIYMINHKTLDCQVRLTIKDLTQYTKLHK